MYKSWLDPLTLAQAMGLSRWQVKRHLKPGVFKKLDNDTLAEYARIFRISIDTLRNFPGEE
jgi:DNA-binding CsgD family transcriptional regulator